MNHRNPKVAIIGCGWLGLALAKKLTTQGVSVLATTTREERFAEIQSTGAQAIKLSLPFDNVEHSSELESLQSCNIVVIAITPKFKQGKGDYPNNIAQLLTLFKGRQGTKICLLSSTGVYGGLAGDVNELSNVSLSEDKVSLLHQAEQLVLNVGQDSLDNKSSINNNIVLRLAGLVGPKRYPGRFFAGKKNIANGDIAVNLVHQEDVVNAILYLLINEKRDHQIGGIYNVVSDTHVSKSEFYRLACQLQQLTPPTFSDCTSTQVIKSLSRIVANKKLTSQGFHFQHGDLINWLKIENGK